MVVIMANKVTKRDNFKAIIEVLKANDKNKLVEVMQHEIDLLDKKASSSKMTKTQEQNVGIKDLILKTMRELDRAVSITELINASEDLKAITNGSNQKVSALMTQLKNDNKVIRETNGKKAVFKIA